MTDLQLLEVAAREIKRTPRGLPTGTPHGVFGPEGSLWFTREGFVAISGFARSLQQNRPELRRGAKFESLRKVVANAAIRLFENRIEQGATASLKDIAQLKGVVKDWFAEVSATRTHIVPCAFIPYPARSFDIGPVRFAHATNLDAGELGVKGHAGFETVWETIERQLHERAASWVAVVEVEGCENARSSELADTAVDIALGAMQSIVAADEGRFMSRTTGRANPPYRGTIAVSNHEISANLQNLEAGRLLLSDTLESILDSGEELIGSFGTRVSAFLRGGSDVQALEQAWCDGAYWFHEGLAEPMDTVAVAKLETALENLFSAGSSNQSRQRIRQALEIMASRESERDDQPERVDFAARVVKARSRVLHGTWSTTRDDPGVDRGSVEAVVREMLTRYSLLLDAYSSEAGIENKDNVKSFFTWVEQTRTRT